MQSVARAIKALGALSYRAKSGLRSRTVARGLSRICVERPVDAFRKIVLDRLSEGVEPEARSRTVLLELEPVCFSAVWEEPMRGRFCW
jgi:hypothetical protein